MKPFDNYAIIPYRRYEAAAPGGTFHLEECEPDEANVWKLCGHVYGDGPHVIGDFASREYAEEMFQRITGIPFTVSYTAKAHLRIMHAGPKLLEALQALVDATSGYARHFEEHKCAVAVIAEATGSAA
jgi:hypothetical protein